MATTTEGNTPQPYAQGTYSTPNVGTPTHGLAQSGRQNGSENITPGLQPRVSDNQAQAQIHSPSQSQRNISSPTTSSQQNQPQGQSGKERQVEGRGQPVEEEGGAARGESGGEAPASTEPDGGYPKQLHAGHLDGVGPEYNAAHGVTMGDRIQGIKEQVKGTIKRDPELKQTGKERMTGELKRKQKAEEENMDPFNSAKKDEKEDEDEQKDGDTSQASKKLKPDESETSQSDTGTTSVPSSHPTDKGAYEQAASVKPEGAGNNDVEMKARSNAESAQVNNS